MLQEKTKTERLAYGLDEVAELTSTSKPFLRKEIRKGRLKVKRLGRRVLILKEDLQAYLKRED